MIGALYSKCRSRPAMISHRADRRELNAASPLQIYLHDINDTPLLSAEEERDLAERIAAGDPYAREHMVKANLRLVVNIAGLPGQGTEPGRPDRGGKPRPDASRRGFRRHDGDAVQHVFQLLDQAIDPPRGDEQRQADPAAGVYGQPALEVEAGVRDSGRSSGPGAHA